MKKGSHHSEETRAKMRIAQARRSPDTWNSSVAGLRKSVDERMIVIDSRVEKRCPGCYATKPLTAYHKSRSKRDGVDVYCRECASERGKVLRQKPEYITMRRSSHYQRRYGLTLDEYNALYEAQGGVCALCGQPSRTNLAVDHCHETGRVRGLLCTSCNGALGKLGDQLDVIVAKVTAYLGGDAQ